MTQEQHELLKHISQVSFALVDTSLFLDTHPCDQKALEYYHTIRQQRKEAVDKYSRKYGPLLVDQVECDNYWTWVETPWPWEC